jgi:hypothetical protein
MPLMRFDLIEGRSDSDLRTSLDVSYEAMVAAFQVSPRNRYQIVHEHPPTRMIVQDTGLGMTRTAKVVMLQITMRSRTRAEKEEFHHSLAGQLAVRCQISINDVVVNFVTNGDEDWSLDPENAPFLTGDL